MKTSKILMALMSLMVLAWYGCSRDNDIVVIPQAQVNQWKAQTVSPGDSLTLTGTNINLITKVLFGDVAAENIDQNLGKRSRVELRIAVPTFTESTTVKVTAVYNTVCEAVVCEAMEVYVPPVVPAVASMQPTEVRGGEVVTLTGNNLNVVTRILLDGVDVAVRSKDVAKLTFVAPAVESAQTFAVTLVYDNVLGTNQQYTLADRLTVGL